MSDVYNPRYTRGGYGKYNRNKHFVSMEAGTDAFYLEDEANESQWIQNELRADLVRREYYSGIYHKYKNDIITSSKIFHDNQHIYNSFLIKPMTVNINGYFIDVIGNNGFNNQAKINGLFDDIQIKKLNYIQLPDPPENGDYYDFVFLEMCFAELKFSDDIWYLGNKNNSYGLIPNDLFDRRINSETNRRIQLKWNIGVSRVPADYVIANEELLKDKRVFALFDESIFAKYTPAKGAYHKNSIFGFWNATTGLDQKTDSDDIGLWIAGTGLDDTGNSRLHTTNGYSYAIPLFKVKRRNTQSYYSDNLQGSNYTFDDQDCVTNRPDGKFANIIYDDDIVDLRNLIRVDNISKVLHTNFEDLLLNRTDNETKLYSTYFGVDGITPDKDTLLYEGCNIGTLNEELIKNRKEYSFVPGVEQEAIMFGDETYISQDFNVYNVNLNGLTAQFFVKVPSGKNIGLYTIFDTLSGARAIAYIKDKELFVIIDTDMIIYDFSKHINKFTHIAIAIRDTDLELIINNKSVAHKNLSNDINFDDKFTAKFGFADVVNYFSNGCIFDEIELSKVYENQFNRIPKAIGNDNADIGIDTQLGRKSYTLINHIDSYTFHKKFKTDADGKLTFALSLPLKLLFTIDVPTLYFDNESVQVDTEVSVQWQQSNNKWYCTINGLGAMVTYSLVIIATVLYPNNQGLVYLPKRAHAAYIEKSNKTFYAVMDSVETQNHNIGHSVKNKVFTNKDKMVAVNPYVARYGFCTYLEYYMIQAGSTITLAKNLYTDIVGIYSVIYKEQNILHDFYMTKDSIIINLTMPVENDEIQINLVTNENCCVYSQTKSGILNLYQLEEITDYGNGTRTTFTYRSNTKIVGLIQSQLENHMYHYVYVNDQPERVNITIDGTFIHYTFENPPVNKADIRTYIVTEYDLLRSERLEFVYEIDKQVKTVHDISDLNQTEVTYHENEIFVTTDGYGIYPYQKQNLNNREIRLSELSAPLKDITITLDKMRNIGDLVITVDNDLNIPVHNNPYSYGPEEQLIVDNSNDTRYSTLRVVTTDDPIQDGLNVHGSAAGVIRSSSGMTYSYDSETNEIPLFTFKVDNGETHPLEDSPLDAYSFYMLNKTMPTLNYLPKIELLKFKMSPVDLLNSKKCEIIFDNNNEAHIITKDTLPISTNLSAQINYCVPNFSGSFLTTFNNLQTEEAIPVAKGYRNCSIDNKSFYSLTLLDEKIAHINVLPFLIKDPRSKLLKMGIFAQFSEDNRICIEVGYAAMDIYQLNEKYLIKHV